MVWYPLLPRGQGTLDHGGDKIMGENFMLGQIFEKKGKISITMDGKRH